MKFQSRKLSCTHSMGSNARESDCPDVEMELSRHHYRQLVCSVTKYFCFSKFPFPSTRHRGSGSDRPKPKPDGFGSVDRNLRHSIAGHCASILHVALRLCVPNPKAKLARKIRVEGGEENPNPENTREGIMPVQWRQFN